MANQSFKVKKILNIEPTAVSTVAMGDIAVSAASGQALYNDGVIESALVTEAGASTLTNKTFNAAGTGNVLSNVANSHIASGAAIAYSKLNLAGTIVNADISASAAIAYSKLALTGSILNADISASAAIAYSKLSLGTSIVNADISASAAIAYSKLNLATSIVNADVATAAAIARSKLASGSNNHVVINDGSGVMSSEATLAQSRGGTGFGTYATGDILYASASNTLSKLPAGSDGQFIKQASGVPSWASLTTSPLNVKAKTANFTLTSSEDFVTGDASGGAFTFTLPAASTAGAGKIYYLKKIDSSLANQITISRAGSDTIDGATSVKLATQYDIIGLISDGTATWNVFYRWYPQSWTAYTPTFTGFGTVVSIAYYWRRVGDSVQLRGTATAGTPTSTEARISLPSGLTSSSSISTLELLGTIGRDINAAGYFSGYAAIEASKTYLVFTRQTSAEKMTNKINADTWNAGEVIWLTPVTIAISGWT